MRRICIGTQRGRNEESEIFRGGTTLKGDSVSTLGTAHIYLEKFRLRAWLLYCDRSAMPSPTHPLKQVAVASRTTSRECSPCHRTLTACASNAPSASIWSSVSADASPPRAVACATYLGRRRTSRHVSVSEVERCLPRAFRNFSLKPPLLRAEQHHPHTEGSLGSAGLALGRSPGGQQPRQQLLRMMCMPLGASPQQRSAAAWLLPGGRRLCGGAARPSCCARWRGQGAAAAPHGRGTRQGASGPTPPRPPASPLCPGSARPGLSPPCDTRSRDTAAPLPCGAAGKGGRLQKHLVPKRAAPQSTAAPCVVCARASRVTQAPRQDATCKVSARAFQHRGVQSPSEAFARLSPALPLAEAPARAPRTPWRRRTWRGTRAGTPQARHLRPPPRKPARRAWRAGGRKTGITSRSCIRVLS